MNIPEKNKKFFMDSLERQNAVYDDEWKCPRTYLEKANYHTNLFCQNVHSTVAAFTYANALLATGRGEDLKRAVEVLDHAAHLQDKNMANPTFGIWSWYMEEPLDKMSPPDWNWADFCGVEICQTLTFHGDRLPKETKEYLEETLRCCALSIFRRNVLPGYTNISIKGSYVTLTAGQLFDWEEMKNYGKTRFERAWKFNTGNKSFAEYNSATYTVVAITDLSRIYNLIQDEDVHKMAEDLLDLAWKTVSEHFHAPTNQWVGPNARSYTFLTEDAALSFLRNALDNGEEMISDDKFIYNLKWAYVPMHCPEKYLSAFKKCVPHDVNIGFNTSGDLKDPKDRIAMAHMTEKYVLSSWEHHDTWNQRRNLIAYWGGNKPRFMNATILHNLYDFSSGMFVTSQKDGNALLAGSLCTDGGDTHCNLDMIKNGTINAYDLRMRIELGGGVEGKPEVTDRLVTYQDGGVNIRMELLDGQFDGQPLKFVLQCTEDDLSRQQQREDQHRRFVGDELRWYIDIVFYEGKDKDIDLNQLKNAYAAVAVSMEGCEAAEKKVEVKDGMIFAQTRMAGDLLSAVSPEKPVPVKKWTGYASLNGKTLRSVYGLPE